MGTFKQRFQGASTLLASSAPTHSVCATCNASVRLQGVAVDCSTMWSSTRTIGTGLLLDRNLKHKRGTLCEILEEVCRFRLQILYKFQKCYGTSIPIGEALESVATQSRRKASSFWLGAEVRSEQRPHHLHRYLKAAILAWHLGDLVPQSVQMPSFNPSNDIPDLTGKVILVTGGNAGLGEATIRALAKHNPACIYLCARRKASADEAIVSIKSEVPAANIRFLELDLSSLESVKRCATAFNDSNDRLDLLFLNAGISCQEPSLTKEGYEATFGVNHIGHALLTQLMLPKMIQTAEQSSNPDVRIIVISSEIAQQFIPSGGLALDNMQNPTGDMIAMYRYGHSKLANIMFAKKLAQMYPQITTVSLHPGVVKTDLLDKNPDSKAKFLLTLFKPVIWFRGVSVDEGAKTQLWAATAIRGNGGVQSGKFYMPIGQEKLDKNAEKQVLVDQLWDWTTEQLSRHNGGDWP